jgi:peptidoglycan/xylan/chitin deacetylase (PgdA/CDA1 family)
MKKFVRAAVFRLLRLSLFPTILRLAVQRRRVTILVYHDPPATLFRRHVEELSKRYSIVTLGAVVDALSGHDFAGLPRRALAITFDDGHRRNFELAETLRANGVQATLFLCAEMVGTNRGFWFKHARDLERLKHVPDSERLELLAEWGFREDDEFPEREVLNADELRDLAGAFDLQSHTLTHPILPGCSDAKAWEEISESARLLKDCYGIDARGFAYPNGSFSDRDVALTKKAGYQYAVSMGYGFVSPRSDVYRLPRIPIHDEDGVDELLVKASGCWRPFAAFSGLLRQSARRRVA